MKRIVEKVKTHRKIVHAHLKKHHKKYFLGIISAALLVKIIPAFIAGLATWHFNYSFADEHVNSNNSDLLCPEGYEYGTYENTIQGYDNVSYPPNRNRENYQENFEIWEENLEDKESKEFTFGPLEGCIPEDGKLEECTDSDTYDYVFCTINMIPLNNECPEGYSFVNAGVAGPYDLCQGKTGNIVDRKGYIHTYMIPLQNDCEFFRSIGVLPADGHCDLNRYTVTFYDDDGESVLGTMTVDPGEAATYPNDIPTKQGNEQNEYSFMGWYDGTGTDAKRANLDNILEDKSVYAMYAKGILLSFVSIVVEPENYGQPQPTSSLSVEYGTPFSIDDENDTVTIGDTTIHIEKPLANSFEYSIAYNIDERVTDCENGVITGACTITVKMSRTEINTDMLFSVKYTDGVEDEEIFADQVTTGLELGSDIPAFSGTLNRTGYTFSGWSPEVTGKVEGNQTYVATWYINENGGNNNSGDDNGGNSSGANEGETTGSGANVTEGVCSSKDLLVTYPISGDYLKLEDVRLTWHLSGSDCSGETFTIKIYGGTNTGYVTLGRVSANSGEFDDLSGFNVSGLLGSKFAIFLGDSDPLKDSPDFYIDEEKPTVISSYKFTPERTTTFGLNDKVDIIFTGSEELTGITVNVLGRNASFVSKTGLRYKYSIQLSTGNNTGGFIYNISFRDVAGNTGYYEYYNSGLTTDTTVPEISELQFIRVSEKTGQVSFSLTKTGNVTFKYVLSGGKATETLSDTNTSSFSSNLSKARTDKASYVYKYVITVEDLVGNKNYYAGTFQLSGNTFGYTLVTSTGSNIKTGTAVSMITILSDELSAFSGCKAKTGMNYSLIQYNVTVNKNPSIVKVQMPKFNDSTIQSSAETVSRLLVNALQGSTISGLNQSKLNVFAGELNDYFVLVKMKRDPEICDANLSILPSLYMTRLLNTLKAYKIIN